MEVDDLLVRFPPKYEVREEFGLREKCFLDAHCLLERFEWFVGEVLDSRLE